MEYMSCPEAARKWGIKTGTKTLRGKTHTGYFKNRLYVADTKGRRKTDRQTNEKVIV